MKAEHTRGGRKKWVSLWGQKLLGEKQKIVDNVYTCKAMSKDLKVYNLSICILAKYKSPLRVLKFAC